MRRSHPKTKSDFDLVYKTIESKEFGKLNIIWPWSDFLMTDLKPLIEKWYNSAGWSIDWLIDWFFLIYILQIGEEHSWSKSTRPSTAQNGKLSSASSTKTSAHYCPRWKRRKSSPKTVKTRERGTVSWKKSPTPLSLPPRALVSRPSWRRPGSLGPKNWWRCIGRWWRKRSACRSGWTCCCPWRWRCRYGKRGLVLLPFLKSSTQKPNFSLIFTISQFSDFSYRNLCVIWRRRFRHWLIERWRCWRRAVRWRTTSLTGCGLAWPICSWNSSRIRSSILKSPDFCR